MLQSGGQTGVDGCLPLRVAELGGHGDHRALDAADLPPGFTTDITGNTILLNHSSDGVARNQVTQVGFAAGMI